MALSLLLQRRLSSLRATLSFFPSHPKPFCSLSSLQSNWSTQTTSDQPNIKPSSLSARMSFVFDQIDAIERERAQKDQTLQRIRAWRESKKTKEEETFNEPIRGNSTVSNSAESGSVESEVDKKVERGDGVLSKEVELVHPWPEWIELMERLVQQNYFDHRRKDEDKMVENLGFDMPEMVEEGFDFTTDWKTVQTAVLNFGRDRFDILRSLSRQDIQILVGYGCPSTDKKVVFSAKLLRKHVHLDEGDVCSSCSLRSSCERAFLLTNKEDEARTIDMMRVLLTYGFDPVNGSVPNKSLLKIKSVKTVVRKLLHEVVKLSSVPIDPNLPPPVIKKPPPKVKQPPPPPKRRVGRDDIEMKKGDWLCPKCDFMNFAKNTVCLQCDAKRPKRQLLPGEWECPQCNFLNYRRNMVCFHCEHNRPPDEFMGNQMQERQHGPRMRLEKVTNRAEVSNAWNFDFDDNESDGADIAAFENADSQKLDEDFPLDSRPRGDNFRGPEDDFYENKRPIGVHGREYLDHGPKKPGMGFDDFDDEDDINSYELDTPNRSQVQKTSSIDFSELEDNSDSEDIEGTGNSWPARHGTSSRTHKKPSKPMRRKAAFSDPEDDKIGFGSDDDLPVHPNWKSSHVADSRQRTRGRQVMNFSSDDDLGLSSGNEDIGGEDFGSRQKKGNKRVSSRSDFGRRVGPNFEDESSGLESDDDDLRSSRDRFKVYKAGPDRRGNTSNGRGSMIGGRRNSFKDDFDRSSQRSRGNNRRFRGDDYDGRGMSSKKSDSQNIKSTRREGSYNQQRGRSRNFDDHSDSYFDDDRHRRPRINVR
ncbi:unnamed protein product [Ilex paraguariensis]|uniref:RanBP2-type domain-containing protein n=1 Tax=Ilex paraguariensis TaxID=185542 RepID=A0ABC8RYH4_9AQUA